MKIFTLFIGLIFISHLTFAQADVWSPVVTDGFSNPNNYGIVEFDVFKGQLYAATAQKAVGTAQLWRSTTGNTGSWTQVTNFIPALPSAVKNIPSFGKTNLGGGIMWLGTGSPNTGTRIYRSTDGSNWTAISKKGFGNPGLITPSPNMVVFQGTSDTIPYLYAGGGSHGGSTNAEVFRIPYNSTDSADWVKLIDFDTVATTASDIVDLISYWCVWNNKIYFSGNGSGQIWESSDGINFTQNLLGGTGYGFGVPSNIVIACLQVFNDTLFAATTNKILGGQMYRTGDGINWQSVTTDAFGKGNSAEELHNIDTAFGYIWVTAYTDTATSNGCPIWRSSDGWFFVQSNTDGFGNPDIDGENPVTISFGNNMYFGGPNYTAGGQIWRTTVATEVQNLSNNILINVFPNPNNGEFTVYGLQFPVQLQIYNSLGQIVHEQTLNSNLKTVNLSEAKSGIYFLQIKSDNFIQTEKLEVIK
ncbi:MAG: T9SS type A sorting domain-containing protein [Bacteroidetes bacterium]|nr:T9SS type A sorting domain-containing protein [Bacteroidota bacterium]